MLKWLVIGATCVVLVVVAIPLAYSLWTNPRVADELRNDPDGERARKVMLISLPSGREMGALLLEPEQIGAYYGPNREQRELVRLGEGGAEMLIPWGERIGRDGRSDVLAQGLDAAAGEMVDKLKARGLTKANRSALIRYALGEVDLDSVVVREPAMTAAEILISESQERMLAIVEPQKVDAVLGICARWETGGAVIGTVTGGAPGSRR